MKRLENKIAIVTGAGSIGPGWGNGKAAAVLYAREGATVFAVDVNLAAAEETCDLIKTEGGNCTAYAANVAAADEVRTLVETCMRTYGRVDVLHNNVGIVATGGPVELNEADWDRSMAVNAKSVFLLCKHVLPIMQAQAANAFGIRGAIVNIGTVGGLRWVGVPYIAYSASKAAVIQMTQSVALQYARKGIRCNCVIPGFIDTPLVKKSLAATYASSNDPNAMDKVTAARNRLCPMGHQGDAWDVAYAALFLASDEAKYITGTNLMVDGGLGATTVTLE
jgi:NAD(P)-dependent dehydrogenase (short-subunit alcohol dehydrogenase family)